MKASRKLIPTTVYIDPEQMQTLRLLAERTHVPVAVYIREGIDAVLANPDDVMRAVARAAAPEAALDDTP